MSTVYLNNTEHGRMMNQRFAAKAKKNIREQREKEIANGTYVSYEQGLENYVSNLGEFKVSLEKDSLLRGTAQDLFQKYVPLFFSHDDREKLFERLELSFVHYFKEIKTFELTDECNKTIYLKISRTSGEKFIKVQRMKDEWLKQESNNV